MFNIEDQGSDRIADFSDGFDLITLIGIEAFGNLTITQLGNDAHIAWASESDLTLLNFDGTQLGADDFIFI